MPNRKQESGSRTARITRTGLSESTMKKYFPTARSDSTGFAIRVNDVSIGWLVLEELSEDTLNAHVYILKEYRGPANLLSLCRQARRGLREYLASTGYTKVVAGCSSDDTVVQRLLTLLGFDPELVWFGSLDLTGE